MFGTSCSLILTLWGLHYFASYGSNIVVNSVGIHCYCFLGEKKKKKLKIKFKKT